MRASALLLAALCGPLACSGRAGTAAESGQGRPPAEQSSASDPSPASPPPAQPPAARARLAESGLAPGEHLEPFHVLHGASEPARCLVCDLGDVPKVIAVGQLGDAEFEEDVKDIDAIVAKWGADRVKAFAVVEVDEDDRSAPWAQLEQLRNRLDVSIPVVIPAAEDGGREDTWRHHYHVTRSRTLMFADATDEVKWSAIAPEHLGGLDEAIRAALGS